MKRIRKDLVLRIAIQGTQADIERVEKAIWEIDKKEEVVLYLLMEEVK